MLSVSYRGENELSCENLLQLLDLILVGDERRLVDAIPADQQLVVQSQSQVCQTETLLQREVQSLQGEHQKLKHYLPQLLRERSL